MKKRGINIFKLLLCALIGIAIGSFWLEILWLGFVIMVAVILIGMIMFAIKPTGIKL